MTSSDRQALRLLSAPAPGLKTLYFGSGLNVLPTLPLFGGEAKLSTLKLYGSCVPWDSPAILGLRSLVLVGLQWQQFIPSANELLHILKESPSLVHLELQSIILKGGPISPGLQHISLPHLRHMSLQYLRPQDLLKIVPNIEVPLQATYRVEVNDGRGEFTDQLTEALRPRVALINSSSRPSHLDIHWASGAYDYALGALQVVAPSAAWLGQFLMNGLDSARRNLPTTVVAHDIPAFAFETSLSPLPRFFPSIVEVRIHPPAGDFNETIEYLSRFPSPDKPVPFPKVTTLVLVSNENMSSVTMLALRLDVSGGSVPLEKLVLQGGYLNQGALDRVRRWIPSVELVDTEIR
ncbi:hypothetical protein FRB99_008873 [Tulasnella sp. 403]|nr:hypothetical protein FRB99_008873 [Tulasnella sp. 403]